MTAFAVKPAALEKYADLLGGAGTGDGGSLDYQYLIDYASYVEDHVKIDVGAVSLVFRAIQPKITEINSRLSTDSSLISTNLIESSTGLDASAKTYRTTDHDAAARTDALYKPGHTEPLDDSATSAHVEAPKGKLVEPDDEGVVPELAQELLDSAGVFSESDLVLKILRWCGLDVIAWVTDRLAGDHQSLARCKSALEHLAEFDEVASDDVTAGAAHMLTDWTGNAADAAQTFFAKTAEGLSSHSVAVDSVVSRMQALMVGLQEGSAALEGAITTALDRAIEAAAAVAAAGCLQEVPGVDVLADIIGGAEVYRVYKAVKEVTDIWNVIWAGHEGLVGIIAGLVGGLSGWDVSSELPTAGYYNASQGPAPNYNAPDVPPRPGQPR